MSSERPRPGEGVWQQLSGPRLITFEEIADEINRATGRAVGHGGSRESFEAPWVRWHYVRTAAEAVALVLCVPRYG